MNNSDKILVEIASYLDPDLLNTVNSAIKQADYPERVFFSICYQSDDEETLKKLKKIKNCKIKHLKQSEAKGTCYARNICQQMIEDEKYVYQIDSHMRFCKHWDTKLIEQLLSLNDPKATISFYPASMSKEMEKLPVDDKIFDGPSAVTPIINYPRRFRNYENNFIEITASAITEAKGQKPLKSPFVAAGNFFSFAEIHKKIFHDPEMFFAGDELPMAVRYYTHGWNNYCPSESYIYHKYHRAERKVPLCDAERSDNEKARLAQVVNPQPYGPDLGKYGLGKERTLQQFMDYSGIDFKKRIIYMNGESGQYDNPELKNKVSYLQRQSYNKLKNLAKKEKIEVLMIDLTGDYEKCLESCAISTVRNDVRFIIGTTKEVSPKEKISNKKIKQIKHFNKTADYSTILSELIDYLDDCYTLVIDSTVNFIKGWDKDYCETIKICGDDSALTSWVWRTPNGKNPTKVTPYLNAKKEFERFSGYLPVLKQKDSQDFRRRTQPLQTPFISNGLLFCHSKILKEIRPDPSLSYKEQSYIYSARLWTKGVDLYYPKNSFFYRTIDENTVLDNGKHNYKVICGLMGRYTRQGKLLNEDYKYKLGTKRPLWTWYNLIGYDYTEDLEIKTL